MPCVPGGACGEWGQGSRAPPEVSPRSLQHPNPGWHPDPLAPWPNPSSMCWGGAKPWHLPPGVQPWQDVALCGARRCPLGCVGASPAVSWWLGGALALDTGRAPWVAQAAGRAGWAQPAPAPPRWCCGCRSAGEEQCPGDPRQYRLCQLQVSLRAVAWHSQPQSCPAGLHPAHPLGLHPHPGGFHS